MRRILALAIALLPLATQEVVRRTPIATVAGGGHTFSYTNSISTHCTGVGSSTTASCSMDVDITGNKLILITLTTQSLTGTLAVTDGASCTALKTTPNGSSNTHDATSGTSWLFFIHAPSGCTRNWSATATSTTFFGITVDVFDVSGAGAVVQDGNDVIGSGTIVTTVTTPTVPSPTAGDLQVCFVSPQDSITSATSPWTGNGGGAGGDMLEYILSSSASQAGAMAQGSASDYDSIGAAFK